jgi:hypothetical protein
MRRPKVSFPPTAKKTKIKERRYSIFFNFFIKKYDDPRVSRIIGHKYVIEPVIQYQLSDLFGVRRYKKTKVTVESSNTLKLTSFRLNHLE